MEPRRLVLCFLTVGAVAAPRARAIEAQPEGRRAVRGIPVDPQPNESPELAGIRQFEERAFPRFAPPITDPRSSPLSERFLKGLKQPDLPVRWDARVVRFLEFYKNDPKGREIMSVWLRKQGRWRALMEQVLARHDLPRDLIYVSMIESGYEPTDLSRVGAVGLWQFMVQGGRIYGLEQNYWIDQRRDPERSTEAVALYFKDLLVRFGNWHLALAAFNAGYGNVLRSMQKYNTNDFWDLCKHESGLPWETCVYVPKAIASAIVGLNRSAFGYDNITEDRPYSVERVPVAGGTTLAAAAKACGLNEADLAALNIELRRNRTPPGHKYDLRVPSGRGDQFRASFGKGDPETSQYETYRIRFGERLDDIARTVKVSVRELKRINHVSDSTELRAGVEILVPRERGSALPTDLPAAEEDTYLVALPDRPFAYPDRKRVFYRTRDGDTIADIAAYFHVRADDVALWNRLESQANLTSKMVLQIYVPKGVDTSGALLVPDERVRIATAGSSEFLDAAAAQRGRKRTSYVCKRGDTLTQVGRRFGLTPGDLARINQFSYNTELAPGQNIIVYVPVTPAAKKEAQGRLRQAARAKSAHAAAARKTKKKKQL